MTEQRWYRYRNLQGDWVENLTRPEAIEQASAMVKVSLLFDTVLIWTVGTPRIVAAIVTKARTRKADEELQQAHGRFAEVIRV